MNKDKKGGNLIISPLIIFRVLILAANGEKGKTQSEMFDLLRSDNINVLNKIYYEILSILEKF